MGDVVKLPVRRTIRVRNGGIGAPYVVEVVPASDDIETATFSDPVKAGLHAKQLEAEHGSPIDWSQFNAGYLVPAYIEDAWKHGRPTDDPQSIA